MHSKTLKTLRYRLIISDIKSVKPVGSQNSGTDKYI